jgi:RNA polymerase sigma-70 factor (ECF subfamily)
MDGQNVGQVTGGQRDADLEVIPLGTVERFDAFFRREYPRLVTLARALSGSRAHAEDLAQDAMIVVLRRWDEIARFDNPTAYARRTCANLAVSSRRRRWAEVRALVRLASYRDPLPSMGEDERFWDEVRALPKREAQVVALYYGCDLPLVEIAELLGIANGTVKAHLSHARDRLASRLAPDGPSSLTGDEVTP